MITEEEAKTKWCPHVRHVAGDANQASNAAGYAGGRAHEEWNCCIGSKCMAWRFVKYVVQPGVDNAGNWNVNDVGYCGLSGKPER